MNIRSNRYRSFANLRMFSPLPQNWTCAALGESTGGGYAACLSN